MTGFWTAPAVIAFEGDGIICVKNRRQKNLGLIVAEANLSIFKAGRRLLKCIGILLRQRRIGRRDDTDYNGDSL